jgi:hypothetical protein
MRVVLRRAVRLEAGVVLGRALLAFEAKDAFEFRGCGLPLRVVPIIVWGHSSRRGWSKRATTGRVTGGGRDGGRADGRLGKWKKMRKRAKEWMGRGARIGGEKEEAPEGARESRESRESRG